ncbi:MAG: hypothetical protein AB8V46_04595 [Candidatus Midichloria sp.]
MQKQVFSQGSSYDFNDLVKQSTAEVLNPIYYINQMKRLLKC